MARAKAATEIYELRITLLGIRPPIWRRIAVPGDVTLAELHRLIQTAMGWTDSHLHEFVTPDGIRYEDKDPDLEPDRAARDERWVRLRQVAPSVKSRLRYDYDFGDDWNHRIDVVRIGPPKAGVEYPLCLGGKRACPPEDCGGVYGYWRLLEALADPEHEDHDDLLDSAGEDFDPEAFEKDEVTVLMQADLHVPGRQELVLISSRLS